MGPAFGSWAGINRSRRATTLTPGHSSTSSGSFMSRSNNFQRRHTSWGKFSLSSSRILSWDGCSTDEKLAVKKRFLAGRSPRWRKLTTITERLKSPASVMLPCRTGFYDGIGDCHGGYLERSGGKLWYIRNEWSYCNAGGLLKKSSVSRPIILMFNKFAIGVKISL